MPKKDEIEVEGKVIEALPNSMFKVEIDEQHQVLAVLSGRIRMNFVRIVPGDKVKVVLSPYDLTRGRITWRVRSLGEASSFVPFLLNWRPLIGNLNRHFSCSFLHL